MAASGDLILTFLGIEILSIATYILAGFKRTDARSVESSLKYFLLGSFATAFLLYGIALIYGSTGTTNYEAIRTIAALARAAAGHDGDRPGIVCWSVSGSRSRSVPFHAWAPDVYEGAPTAVTAFMTVGPKAAGFAALMRVLVQALPALGADWSAILWASSILTMTVGNIVAILQSNIKRMLAYSAIAHAGYILIGIVAHSAAGHRAVIFYLIVYTAMNLGALSIVLSLSRKGDQRVNLEDYAGLGKTQPLAGGGPVALPDFPGRIPAHGRLHREVLPVQRRHPAALCRPCHRRGAEQRYFRLLLLPAYRVHVHEGAACRLKPNLSRSPLWP